MAVGENCGDSLLENIATNQGHPFVKPSKCPTIMIVVAVRGGCLCYPMK